MQILMSPSNTGLKKTVREVAGYRRATTNGGANFHTCFGTFGSQEMHLSSTTSRSLLAKPQDGHLETLRMPRNSSSNIMGQCGANNFGFFGSRLTRGSLNSILTVPGRLVLRLANAGGVFRDHLVSWIVGFTSKIGIANSFIAELWGL